MDSTIDLVSGEFWGTNPHGTFEWLRANDPVPYDEEHGVWGLTRYDDVRRASKEPTLFSNAGGIRPDADPIAMMIDMDDPAHSKRRKLVSKGFTPGRVRAQEAVVRSVVDDIIDQVCETGSCDFVMDLAAWLPLVMIGDALGFEAADRQQLLTWSDDLVRGLGAPDPAVYEKAAMASLGYAEYMVGVIEDRRAAPRDDLITTLVNAEIDGEGLDQSALVYETLLILIGGDETTRHVITGGLFQLLSDRSNWEALREDRSLLPVAIEEMLRWVSPVKNMARTATRDVEIRGRTISEGQKVMLLYPSANRDEDHFDDSMAFDMRRTPNDHLAFGFGSHFCLGSALARLELSVMFDRLLDRLPDIEMVSPTEPAYRPANFVSGYEVMPVQFTPTPRLRPA